MCADLDPDLTAQINADPDPDTDPDPKPWVKVLLSLTCSNLQIVFGFLYNAEF